MTLLPSFARAAAACALALALSSHALAAEDATAPAAATESGATAAPATEAPKKHKAPAPDTANSLIGHLSLWANLLDPKEGDPKAAGKWEKFETSLKKHPDDFAAMDADKDGKISHDELQAVFDRTVGELKDRFPDDFAKVDADKNGALSKSEFSAYGKVVKAARDAEKAAKEGTATGAVAAPATSGSGTAAASDGVQTK